MLITPINTDLTLANPSRAEIQARLAQQASVPELDMGIYSIDVRYDPAQLLSRLPGDDLQSITASATTDAATHSRSGWFLFAWAVPTWIAGLVCLFLLGAPMVAIVALCVGTLGIWGGVRNMARSNHDKILMNDLHRMFATADAAHRA